MSPPLRLADFEGRWSLDRRIRGGAGETTFRGSATLAGGIWHEAGTITGPDGREMTAERRYLWREAEDGGIEVRFGDGRLFHRISLGAARAEVAHDCPPDTYLGLYGFEAFPDWTLTWTVTGPRKDYVSTTLHRRLAPSAPVRDTAANHAKEST